MAILEESLKTMVRIFRRECHRVLESERTTILGANEILMVLQLAIADVNKQECGEFSVVLSEVLMIWKYLLCDKLHLPHNDSPRPENYDLIRRAYESFLKRTNTVDLIDIQSMYKQLKVDSDPGETLSSIQLFQFLTGNAETGDLRDSTVPLTPSSKSRPCSTQVKKVMRMVFCSYLNLLVNTKNDIALAHILDTPNRSLGRAAFTNLKHAARDKDTSLFLAVTSFVRAIQLGGRGYAPAESDPLRKHLKGLSDFVHFMDNLDEILGDNPDPSIAGIRLVTSIRASLVKGRSRDDMVYSAAEETARDLQERIQQIHHTRKKTASGTGISPARPKAYAINHATALGGRETVKVLMALLDEEALVPPCRNKADLLSEDLAVLTEAEEICMLTLFRSPAAPSVSSPKPLANRVQDRQESFKPKVAKLVIRSQFACTYLDEELPLNRVLEFPSTSQVPTCVHSAPKRTITTVPDEGDWEPKTTSAVEDPGTEVNTESVRKERGRPLGQRCGNAPERLVVQSRKKPTSQTAVKACKRKQVDGNEDDSSENQPPQKKPSITVSKKMPVKNAPKAPGKKKLISGQGKLTSFFRV
ncbi:PCNA-interacting partner [Osmerus eperlanus]|uniref:PCNA-interacting partner n=1 Tax=Osmerus eperlanus TaxID=29151 RepID=UPI002E12D313